VRSYRRALSNIREPPRIQSVHYSSKIHELVVCLIVTGSQGINCCLTASAAA
jgi:hypothetical protein